MTRTSTAHELLHLFLFFSLCGLRMSPLASQLFVPPLKPTARAAFLWLLTPQICRCELGKVPTNLHNMHLKRLKSAVLVIPVRVVTVYTCKSRMHCRTN